MMRTYICFISIAIPLLAYASDNKQIIKQISDGSLSPKHAYQTGYITKHFLKDILENTTTSHHNAFRKLCHGLSHENGFYDVMLDQSDGTMTPLDAMLTSESQQSKACDFFRICPRHGTASHMRAIFDHTCNLPIDSEDYDELPTFDTWSGNMSNPLIFAVEAAFGPKNTGQQLLDMMCQAAQRHNMLHYVITHSKGTSERCGDTDISMQTPPFLAAVYVAQDYYTDIGVNRTQPMRTLAQYAHASGGNVEHILQATNETGETPLSAVIRRFHSTNMLKAIIGIVQRYDVSSYTYSTTPLHLDIAQANDSGSLTLREFEIKQTLLDQSHHDTLFGMTAYELAKRLRHVGYGEHVYQHLKQYKCGICRRSLAIASIYRLPCKHHFHNTCISTWMPYSRTCPLCRHTI